MYSTYLSPFTWRYGTEAMRRLWSEEHKRRLWRQVWVALAQAQSEFGLVSPEQVEDLRTHAAEVDVERALQIEAEIHHDLMAEIRVFAGQCPAGGGIIHLGATSMDIEDNAEALRLRAALDLVLGSLRALLHTLAERIEAAADLPVMAFTHLQPAEPTTLGYRLAQYAQDLLTDYEDLTRLRGEIRGKGFKGAVGTSASYAELVGVENLPRFETRLSELLGLPFFPVATQTYPRKMEYRLLSALAGLGGSLYKFAFDLRLLQSPPLGEWSEPFGAKQVGSSAMPFKRNPIQAEKLDSLGRALAQMPRLAWDNAAHSLLERTLDDSANRRTLLPEAFLTASEMLRVARRLFGELRVDEAAIRRMLETYAPFAATERLLMALGRRGADRQEMHERLRQHALQAWENLRKGRGNPLIDLVGDDPVFQAYLTPEEIRTLMDARAYLGDAPRRARQMAAALKARLGQG
ncbi:MAG TPA: adenylosuccinate lyase [Chloroflexi bacterium]|nr:adenylosuccinate lyase [Chloroflexota bacterium]